MLKFRRIAPLALLALSVPLWAATPTAPAHKKDTKSPAPSAAVMPRPAG